MLFVWVAIDLTLLTCHLVALEYFCHCRHAGLRQLEIAAKHNQRLLHSRSKIAHFVVLRHRRALRYVLEGASADRRSR